MYNKDENLPKKPYRSLLLFPMPCECRAAAIYNKSITAMEEKDVSEVSYRYLQAKEGVKNSLIEASLWSFGEAILLFGLKNIPAQKRLSPIIIMPFMICGLSVPPNIGNAIRYLDIKKETKDWLISDIGEEKFSTIHSTPFNNEGVRSMKTFFHQQQINTDSLEEKNIKRHPVPCWFSSE